MHVNVSHLLKEPSGAVRAYEVAERVALEDGPHEVRGSVKLFRTDRGLWVTATLESSARRTCSRCLEESAQPFEMVIDEETQPDDAVMESDGERLKIDDGALDLTEAVRQYFEIAAPMKAVCSPDCKGICIGCGANLNDTTCGCGGVARDPKWGALLELAPSGR